MPSASRGRLWSGALRLRWLMPQELRKGLLGHRYRSTSPAPAQLPCATARAPRSCRAATRELRGERQPLAVDVIGHAVGQVRARHTPATAGFDDVVPDARLVESARSSARIAHDVHERPRDGLPRRPQQLHAIALPVDDPERRKLSPSFFDGRVDALAPTARAFVLHADVFMTCTLTSGSPSVLSGFERGESSLPSRPARRNFVVIAQSTPQLRPDCTSITAAITVALTNGFPILACATARGYARHARPSHAAAMGQLPESQIPGVKRRAR